MLPLTAFRGSSSVGKHICQKPAPRTMESSTKVEQPESRATQKSQNKRDDAASITHDPYAAVARALDQAHQAMAAARASPLPAMVTAAVAEDKYAQFAAEISALKEANRRDRVAEHQKYAQECDRLRAEMAALKDAHDQHVTQLQTECDSLKEDRDLLLWRLIVLEIERNGARKVVVQERNSIFDAIRTLEAEGPRYAAHVMEPSIARQVGNASFFATRKRPVIDATNTMQSNSGSGAGPADPQQNKRPRQEGREAAAGVTQNVWTRPPTRILPPKVDPRPLPT
ncbi:hypothetical protein FB451DRAFT_1227195 [Mycena latifolia]|nr:hypothetical protein FB451DRAFT_1227195 [Mycena latifolia]